MAAVTKLNSAGYVKAKHVDMFIDSTSGVWRCVNVQIERACYFVSGVDLSNCTWTAYQLKVINASEIQNDTIQFPP